MERKCRILAVPEGGGWISPGGEEGLRRSWWLGLLPSQTLRLWRLAQPIFSTFGEITWGLVVGGASQELRE